MNKQITSSLYSPLFCFLISLITCSCSIKEDRSNCPDQQDVFSKLIIDMGSCAYDFKCLHIKVSQNKEPIILKTLHPSFNNCMDTILVPNGLIDYTIWGTKSESYPPTIEQIDLLENLPCDSIYAEAKTINIKSSSVKVRPTPHKQFMTLVISLTSSRNGNAFLECGSDSISELTLLPGGLSRKITSAIDDAGMVSFTLTRQIAGNSIMLYTPYLNAPLDIEPILEQIKYDWNKRDLTDVMLEIDEGTGIFKVCVLPWGHGYDVSLRTNEII